MIDIRCKKILRDAWLYRARTLLVIIAVAIGMIGAGALLDAWAIVQRVTTQTYKASHPVSATLHVQNASDDVLARVRALPAIAAVRARRFVAASVEGGAEKLIGEIFVLQDWNAQDIGTLRSERGTWPPRDGEIVVETSSLEFSGATVGGSITLQIGKNPARSLRVSGIARDVGLPPGWMDHVVYLFATPATVASLGAPVTLDEVQVVVRDTTLSRDAVRHIAADVKAELEHAGVHVSAVDVPEPNVHPHAAQMDSLLLTQGAFALLTLLVCAFLIVNLITALLVSQTRQIGVMKALGASVRHISTMYLAHALLLGIIASSIALPVAIAIARPYAALKSEMLNFPTLDATVPWSAILLQFAVGCLLPVAAAAIPVARACRMSVAAALRDPGVVTERLYVRRRPAWRGISRPLQLSIGNAFRRRQRMVLTVLALALGGAVFLGADNLRVAVRASVDRIFAGARYDVLFGLGSATSVESIVAALANVPDIARIETIATTRATLAHDDGMVGDAFGVVALQSGSELLSPVMESGRALKDDDVDTIVVSRRLAKEEPSMQTGATVTLTIDGRDTRVHIAGVFESGPQLLAYAPAAWFNAMRGDARATQVLVATTSKQPALQLDTIVRVRGALERAGISVTGSHLMRETRRAFEDHLLMVVQFLGAMAWVMIAVGGMGLGSTMSLTVFERTREIGILRAIGARHREIVTMVQLEGWLVATLGWCVALPLSLPMSATFAWAFGKVMFPVPMHPLPTVHGAAIWYLLTTIVSLLACAMPARAALRRSVASALSYE
ncbi:MAG: ABC transporter permease [Rudaea sp.]